MLAQSTTSFAQSRTFMALPRTSSLLLALSLAYGCTSPLLALFGQDSISGAPESDSLNDPTARCRQWFTKLAAQSFAAHAREPVRAGVTPADIEPSRSEVRLDLVAEWRTTLAPLKKERTETIDAALALISQYEVSDPREARILRLCLGRELINIGALKEAQTILLAALRSRQGATAPGASTTPSVKETGATPADERGPDETPTRLDIEIARTIAATYRRSDLAKCAEFLRASIDDYLRATPAQQLRSGRGVWNAAQVLANVLSELGLPAEAVAVLEWVYGDLRVERSQEEERRMLHMAAGYARDAGRTSDALATRAWLVTHASEWIWSSSDTSSIPRVTLQDALAAGAVSPKMYGQLIDSLAEFPEARREPQAFARICQDSLVHCSIPSARLIERAEDAVRLLLEQQRPEAAHPLRRQDDALRSVLGALAKVYWDKTQRGEVDREVDLQRVRVLWHSRFPDQSLIAR